MTDMHIGVRMWSTSAVGFVEKSGAEKWGTWAYVIIVFWLVVVKAWLEKIVSDT